MNRKEVDDYKRKVVETCFAGDSAAFEKEWQEGFREIISWKDIETSVHLYPEFEKATFVLIREMMGYLPPRYVTIPYEPFLRDLLYRCKTGSVSFDDLLLQAEAYIIPMRNKEMEQHNAVSYSDWDYQQYEAHLPYFKDMARQRLSHYLGYEPDMHCSLAAELMMRNALASDTFHMPDTLNNTDLQLLSIIKYREVLRAQGREDADASPLVTFDLKARYRSCSGHTTFL